MENVLKHGHRKIGIISVERSENIAIAHRLDGMQEVLEQSGFGSNVAQRTSDFSTRGGAEATASLMQENPDLTAIVSVNDRMAIGAISYLRTQGKQVPNDISVVGYDNISLAAVTLPALTTIDQKASELGKISAELLFKKLNGEPPSRVVVPPELVNRDSLALRR